MKFKLDTKEKFAVIEVLEPKFSANMAEEFSQLVAGLSRHNVPHIVLSLQAVNEIDQDMATSIAKQQLEYYNEGNSFVICSLNHGVASVFETLHLLEDMNVTPTQSEAWDIVQMEEIERELLKNFDGSEE